MKRFSYYFYAVILVLLVYSLLVPRTAVSQRQLSASPTPYICPIVAKTNTLEISRCIDEETGFLFYTNQFGWMEPGE